MDADLERDVRRLAEVAAKYGLHAFRIECWDSWVAPRGTKCRSPLFRACTPCGVECQRPDGKLCGCLVEVRYPQYPTGPRVAWTDEWTEAIRTDERIPEIMADIQPEHLLAFAEWQQRMRACFNPNYNSQTTGKLAGNAIALTF
jgi:hypothetical protein